MELNFSLDSGRTPYASGVSHPRCRIRHPQSNPTERVMKELGRLFRAYCHNAHVNWASVLSNSELLFNTTTHSSTGFHPMRSSLGGIRPILCPD
jgi:hypothetical protein